MLNAKCVDSETKQDSPEIGGNECDNTTGAREDMSNRCAREVGIPHVLEAMPVT